MPVTNDMQAQVKAIAEVVKEHVAEAYKALHDRILEQEKEITALKGQISDSAPGKSAYELAQEAGFDGTLQEWLESLHGKDGQDGRDGKDGENGRDGQDGEKGADGIDGKDGRDGQDGKDGEKGQDGKDGQSAYDLAKAHGFTGSVFDWMASLRGADGQKGKDGRDGKDGSHGVQGRDAVDLDILPLIDENKSYPRGTFARHAGGLWRAVKNTSGMDGWECIVNGVRHVGIDQGSERDFTVTSILSDGSQDIKTFVLPVVLDKGIFNKDATYQPGDGVTWAGSFWICQKETTAKPGDGDTWRLAVKKGRDGKDGEKGETGEAGKEGRPGRDLTQLGYGGEKW